jgi:hypothetical protein
MSGFPVISLLAVQPLRWAGYRSIEVFADGKDQERRSVRGQVVTNVRIQDLTPQSSGQQLASCRSMSSTVVWNSGNTKETIGSLLPNVGVALSKCRQISDARSRHCRCSERR